MSAFTIPGTSPGIRRHTGIWLAHRGAPCPPVFASTLDINTIDGAEDAKKSATSGLRHSFVTELAL